MKDRAEAAHQRSGGEHCVLPFWRVRSSPPRNAGNTPSLNGYSGREFRGNGVEFSGWKDKLPSSRHGSSRHRDGGYQAITL
jgi:hypothetical protein